MVRIFCNFKGNS